MGKLNFFFSGQSKGTFPVFKNFRHVCFYGKVLIIIIIVIVAKLFNKIKYLYT